MFPLTSLNRVKSSLGVTSTDQDAILLGNIPTASNRIAKLLRRVDAIEKKSRTEYFSPFTGQRTFRPPAYPIISVTSIYTDSTGRFEGNETLVPATSYFISADRRTIIFPIDPAFTGAPFPGIYPKSLRVIYIGGLAPHAVNSTWDKTGDADVDMEVGNFIKGDESQALGRILGVDADSISYECLYGVFEAETVTEYAANANALQGGGPSAKTDATCTLTAPAIVGGIEQLSLAETCTDLVQACEMLVRYLKDGRDGFELKETSIEGAKKFTGYDTIGRQPRPLEITDLIETYRNKVLA